jgi:hypothetical protein
MTNVPYKKRFPHPQGLPKAFVANQQMPAKNILFAQPAEESILS